VVPGDNEATGGGGGGGSLPVARDLRELTVFAIVWAVVFLWTVMWTLEVRTLVVADVVGHWHWHGQGSGSVKRAAYDGVVCHGGTAALVSAVVWAVGPVRSVLGLCTSTPSGYNDDDEPAVGCADHLIPLASMWVAVTGRNLDAAGKEAARVLRKTHGHLAFGGGVWAAPRRLLFTLTFTIAVACGVGVGFNAFYPARRSCDAGSLDVVVSTCVHRMGVHGEAGVLASCDCTTVALMYAVAAGCVVHVLVQVLLHLFLGTLTVAVDASFACFVTDRDSGVITKPMLYVDPPPPPHTHTHHLYLVCAARAFARSRWSPHCVSTTRMGPLWEFRCA
jgi:hypothetical protein